MAYNQEKKYWENTILALCNNDLLKTELNKWAELNNIQIIWGDPNSPDIVAYPYFAAIIDRKILGKGIYNLYLEYLQDVNTPIDVEKLKKTHGIEPDNLTGLDVKDEHTCIFVDEIKDLEYPKLDFVTQVNIENEETISWILQILDFSNSLVRNYNQK